jgi:serine protease Do
VCIPTDFTELAVPRYFKVIAAKEFHCHGMLASVVDMMRPLSMLSFCVMSSFLLVAICIPLPRSFGQEVIRDAQPVVERSAAKPAIPDIKRPRDDKSTGSTFVSLEPGIDRIFRGDEPQNLKDLKVLQRQQSKVAERVNKVTVNLQHGSTQGSGVIITGDGYILTAAHVAGKPKQAISIILHDGRRVEGVTMGVNRNMDAGLVRITKPKSDGASQLWPHASLPDKSYELKLGQWCIATGHPGGWMPDRPAVIRVGRMLRIIPSTLITDCSLIGGDSGGPLFDLNGVLIGIHSRIGVDVDDNMHVPMGVFRDSWDRLVANEAWGTLPGYKPIIGVVGSSDITRCEIGRVAKDGPADIAGLKAGDIVVRFDNEPIANFNELKAAVDAVVPGERVTVEIQRDNKPMSVRLIVGVEGP